ncbi:thiazole biosynthesis adenylyltransferase ThiF [Lysinibacillus irui]|uniref:Thiazole biosynthesis adenylyltransferase ThiF n=1 Tax=Lysinibacillus irui TaxID=2998077 RepID=A0AAJ5RH34_9BACI|nr:thiazole biosynthesis adenylyltransferase ThiF [Lysinibacillus irui]MEA0552757.1 thiazole biosynthesis adenylyltransferase ThiF [Lysinibacillus irui]MEA0565970.1 thiazole biosynthesis adenylyltransferase ThiF [Lysinibacillus irui]MEA0975337.1 thiazole biosynthesis adenylyltransferase ThiF [Lysinibacillus irui]MEA1041491.1 thiazole biosynthesis adenylyltransferase ThiF [Lysinibacillus irui]WDV05191.1 thiazole biosynthesis adenylyltransferase ThiF [Lysinibacillus irui]
MQNRYSRQQLFNSIGQAGQQSIQQKHVLIIGAGALGSASAEALVRAGVGKLTLIDRDYVEWSNLQRQQLYTEQDAQEKLPKVIAAKTRLQSINKEVDIHVAIMDACTESLLPLLVGVDVMVDATDNFDVRFVMNDLAQKHRIPWVYGSCVGSYGATYTIVPGTTPCLHCLLKVMPHTGMTCDTVGIISPTVQIVAAYQVAEVLKLLVGDEKALRKSYLTFDVWQNQHYEINVEKIRQEDCPSCGSKPIYPYLSYENQTKLEILCGRDAVQIRPPKPIYYQLEQLANQLRPYGEIQKNPYLLSCQAEDYRIVIFQDGRVVIHGIQDIQKAKSIYYRLLG